MGVLVSNMLNMSQLCPASEGDQQQPGPWEKGYSQYTKGSYYFPLYSVIVRPHLESSSMNDSMNM